jgi:hypothetical protein
MLQQSLSPRESDLVAASCLLAERALALLNSVHNQRELRRSAYEQVDSWEGQEPSDPGPPSLSWTRKGPPPATGLTSASGPS